MLASEQHLYETIVQFDKTIVLPGNLKEEVYMTSFSATAP